MKMTRKVRLFSKRLVGSISLMLLSASIHAKDLLAGALSGDVKDTFGADANFWKIFIVADIALATAAAIKTKSYMVFIGVLLISFVPAYLLKAFVFGS